MNKQRNSLPRFLESEYYEWFWIHLFVELGEIGHFTGLEFVRCESCNLYYSAKLKMDISLSYRYPNCKLRKVEVVKLTCGLGTEKSINLRLR